MFLHFSALGGFSFACWFRFAPLRLFRVAFGVSLRGIRLLIRFRSRGLHPAAVCGEHREASDLKLIGARANSRAIALAPLKRTSPIRQWLTYLTLAIAAAVLIGDATTLVYNLLDGDVAIRFLLRVLTIGGIAGTAFVYFLTDLRRDEKEVEA